MSSKNSMNEVEGEKVTENVEGKVSEETSQTAPQTDRQEDVDKPGSASKPSPVQQKVNARETTQKMLKEQIASLEREIAESNAASEQEAGTAEATAAEEAHTDGNGQNPTPTSKTIEVLPLHGDMKLLDPDDIAGLVRAIPVYTCEDVKHLLCGEKERNVQDVIKRDIAHRMINDDGLIKADNLIAISEELFSHVAWGYMSSEHYALDKSTTTVDEIHQAHQTREKSLNDQFSKLGKQAQAL